ncbi:hypothetical protein IA539_02650 [Gordonia sp. zg691]|uniref:hypothetical protein n=1 Tax=Gordonia jinghuaiqii TaxID=2758710 RepID=UPI0016625A9A|nr:hypothetical protein [Gordonia jinghuaiqii]MBD0860113.1 hypothetical protein [Gordonia jinghuaiqii]
MTTVFDVDPYRPARTVDVFGVRWPARKAHAVVAGLAVALLSLLAFGSPQFTAWVTAVTVLAVWWGERYLPGKAATAPASNPPGIS